MPEFPEPRTQAAHRGPAPDSSYAAMIDNLRVLMDRIAGAGLDEAQVVALDADILALTARLDPLQVEESRQMFARVQGVPGHGQTMCPAFAIDRIDADGVSGRITLGRYFLGAASAAHGGAIACAFDEILGIPANFGVERFARTAYLHIDYRSVTPINAELTFSARITSRDGRKRIIRGDLRHGDRLCVEAEGLFVELKPGQP